MEVSEIRKNLSLMAEHEIVTDEGRAACAEAGELLKKLEPMVPSIMQDARGIHSTCASCGHVIKPYYYYSAKNEETYMIPKYCEMCGQAVVLMPEIEKVIKGWKNWTMRHTADGFTLDSVVWVDRPLLENSSDRYMP